MIRKVSRSPVVPSMFSTIERTVLQRPFLNSNSKNFADYRFCINSGIRTNIAQIRSFISSSKRLSDSASNEIDKEMESEKTKLTIINDQKDGGRVHLPYIYKYSKVGFTIGRNKAIGSVALFPGGILSWKVASYHQITPESLAVFPLIEPKLEILILGVGDKVVQVHKSVWDFAKANRIALEVMDTPNACATYNFLTEEGRRTAAALIPPQTIRA